MKINGDRYQAHITGNRDALAAYIYQHLHMRCSTHMQTRTLLRCKAVMGGTGYTVQDTGSAF